jgi:hypothetical protein
MGRVIFNRDKPQKKGLKNYVSRMTAAKTEHDVVLLLNDYGKATTMALMNWNALKPEFREKFMEQKENYYLRKQVDDNMALLKEIFQPAVLTRLYQVSIRHKKNELKLITKYNSGKNV